MNKWLIILSFFLGSKAYSQKEYPNNNFYTYFDLMDIVENKFHSQLILSASIDEIGYNLEYYHIGKTIYSLNLCSSYKRVLPNLGNIWVPQTTDWADLFPMNGFQIGLKSKFFFNKRKFLFAGAKISTGYFWTNENYWHRFIEYDRTSPIIDKINWVNNFRIGSDAIVGRKFVSRFISEIHAELGYRIDQSSFSYQCHSNCSQTSPLPVYQHYKLGFLHFQIIMAFDLN